MAGALEKLRLFEKLNDSQKASVLQNDIEQMYFEDICRDMIEENLDETKFTTDEELDDYIDFRVAEIGTVVNGNYAAWCIKNIEGFKVEHYIGEAMFDDAYERIRQELQTEQKQEKSSVKSTERE